MEPINLLTIFALIFLVLFILFLSGFMNYIFKNKED